MGAHSAADGSPGWTFFLAYAAPDRAVAEQLYELLARETTVFFDQRCLRLGDDWDWALAAAQRRAAITLVLVSTHTGEGFYQREEIAAAIEMAREGAHRVIPIWLTGNSKGPIPYGLRVKQGLTLPASGDLTEIAQRLLAEVGLVEPEPAQPLPAPIATPPASIVASPPSVPAALPTPTEGPDRVVASMPCDPSSPLDSLAFSPDGRFVACGSRASRVASVWSVPAQREVLQAIHDGPVYNRRVGVSAGIFDLVFSADGELVTAGGGDRTARVWDIPSGHRIRELTHSGGLLPAMLGVAFGPDGHVVAACNIRVLDIWTARAGWWASRGTGGTPTPPS